MYKKIAVPLDGSELAECVFPHVKAIAGSSDKPLVMLVQAVEPIAIPYGRQVTGISSIEQLKRFEAHHRVEAERYLKKVEARLRKDGLNTVTHIINGKAAVAISDFVEKNKADLLVLATHGRSGISRLVWGSVADHIIRSVHIPIMLIRPTGCSGTVKVLKS